jgi:hypothetical protein
MMLVSFLIGFALGTIVGAVAVSLFGMTARD